MKLILYLYKKIYFFILSIKLKTLKQTLHLNKNQYKILRDYAHYSNNLYNYGLYIIRQYYFETGKLLNADINGAANILRKNVIGDIRNNQPILGLMFNPIKINIF